MPDALNALIDQRIQAALEGRKLTLDELPIAALIRKIEALGLDPSALPAPLVGTGGTPIEIRFGAQNLTFTAAASSAIATVTHGLGRAPVAVEATMAARNSGALMYAQVDVLGTTSFQVGGICTNSASITGTFPCYWIAIA